MNCDLIINKVYVIFSLLNLKLNLHFLPLRWLECYDPLLYNKRCPLVEVTWYANCLLRLKIHIRLRQTSLIWCDNKIYMNINDMSYHSFDPSPFNHLNINWRDVQKKNVVNNVDMSSLRAPWQKKRCSKVYVVSLSTCQKYQTSFLCVSKNVLRSASTKIGPRAWIYHHILVSD